MKCLSCPRSAKFQLPNNPKIVFCDKICHFDYVNGKREREEEEYSPFDIDDFTTEFLLRVDPLTLINSELVNTKFRQLIFTVFFMKQYVEKHEIPDEFMWWIYTKTRPNDVTREIELIVNIHYDGFFKDRLASPAQHLMNACRANRLDIVEIIFKYKTKISKNTIFRCLEIACVDFNLALFNILIPKIELDTRIADGLLSIIRVHTDEKFRTMEVIFKTIVNYCSDEFLSNAVFYFVDYLDLLKIIYKKIPIEDYHLAEIIYDKPKSQQIMYLERILSCGKPPEKITATLNAIVSTNFGSENEVYRYLKNKFNL